MRLAIFVFVQLIAAAHYGCAPAAPAGDAHGPDHQEGYYNATQNEIFDAIIYWSVGDRHDAHGYFLLPALGTKLVVSAVDPIPDRATILWKTADGAAHRSEVKVANAIPDLKAFRGTVWYKFTENNVEVVPISYIEEDRRVAAMKPTHP